MAKRQSLGRGLGALIPDVSRETTAKKSPAKPTKKSSAAPTKASKRPTALPPKKAATKGAQHKSQLRQQLRLLM